MTVSPAFAIALSIAALWRAQPALQASGEGRCEAADPLATDAARQACTAVTALEDDAACKAVAGCLFTFASTGAQANATQVANLSVPSTSRRAVGALDQQSTTPPACIHRDPLAPDTEKQVCTDVTDLDTETACKDAVTGQRDVDGSSIDVKGCNYTYGFNATWTTPTSGNANGSNGSSTSSSGP